jgi:hypothetical protein
MDLVGDSVGDDNRTHRERLNALKEKWLQLNTIDDLLMMFSGSENVDEVTNRFSEYISEPLELLSIIRNDMWDDASENSGEDDDDEIAGDKVPIMELQRVVEAIIIARNMYMNWKRFHDVRANTANWICDAKSCRNMMLSMLPLDMDNTTVFQKLIVTIVDTLHAQNYRRYEGYLYQAITNSRGHMTYAWRQIIKIDDYVYGLLNCKEYNFELWKMLTESRENVDRTIVYLKQYSDDLIPWLKPDRHVFSFENGIYFANYEYFHYYDNGPLQRDVVSANYFPLEVETSWIDSSNNAFSSIPTPHLDTISASQNLPADVHHWLLTFIGRCIYEVGEMDKWQVFLFIRGIGQTGKGMIMSVLSNIYAEKTGVLSNNVEAKFGISALASKFLFIAPEIRESFCLDQAEMQSMASGESLSAARKFKDPIFIKNWRVPGMFAGNELPAYRDNSNSVSRRWPLLTFDHTVESTDTKLKEKLAAEMAAIIIKSNRIYRSMVRRIGEVGIWESPHFPSYFKERRETLGKETHPLKSFMSSEYIVLPSRQNENLYVPQRVFLNKLVIHAKENGLNANKIHWKSDFYAEVFQRYHCEVTSKPKKLYYPRDQHCRRVNAIYILGCDITSTDE